MKIISKFSFKHVYFMYAFCVAVLILAIYLVTRPEINLHNSFGSTMSAAYVGFMFMIIPLFYFYYNQKYLIKVYVSNNNLVIKNLFKHYTYSISDIQSIDLFARKSLGLLTSQRKSNGINIQANCDQSYFLADIYYSNAPDLKKAIYNNFKPVVCNQIDYENVNVKDALHQYTDSDFVRFSGYFILSPDVITIIISYIIFMMLSPNANIKFILLIHLLLLILLILTFVFKANYFLLSKKQLIIKNQLLWKKNIVFEFNDTKSIFFESHYKGSNSIRINTKDFHSKSFQAGFLTDKVWQKLTDKLKEIGIEVYNEI